MPIFFFVMMISKTDDQHLASYIGEKETFRGATIVGLMAFLPKLKKYGKH
jgi:hypothetical protein